MDELADLLELVHLAARRYRTLRAVERSWTHHGRSETARERWAAGNAGGSLTVFAMGGGEPPEESEQVRRIWLEPPGRYRQEDEHSTVVSDGRTLWLRHPGRPAMVRDVDPADADEGLPGLLGDPAPLLPGLELEIAGRRSVAGREGIVVRATARPGRNASPGFVLVQGADRHELVVDAERGLLLRAASYLDGEPASVSEVLEIAFDEELPAGTFTVDLPAGERVLTEADLAARRPEHLSIEEAGRRVPFGLWIPAAPPEGLHMTVLVMPAFEAWSTSESVHVLYHGPGGLDLTLQETAAGAPGGGAGLTVEREGTSISLMSQSLAREELERLAASLVPAPTDRPRLA